MKGLDGKQSRSWAPLIVTNSQQSLNLIKARVVQSQPRSNHSHPSLCRSFVNTLTGTFTVCPLLFISAVFVSSRATMPITSVQNTGEDAFHVHASTHQSRARAHGSFTRSRLTVVISGSHRLVPINSGLVGLRMDSCFKLIKVWEWSSNNSTVAYSLSSVGLI